MYNDNEVQLGGFSVKILAGRHVVLTSGKWRRSCGERPIPLYFLRPVRSRLSYDPLPERDLPVLKWRSEPVDFTAETTVTEPRLIM